MKNLLSFFLVLFVSHSLYAQETNASQGQAAKVYFLRSDAFPPLAGSYTAFIDDDLTCKISNKKFSVHNASAGSHVVSSQILGSKPGKKADKEKIQVEAGKTYYIQLVYKHGIFSNKLKCKEIDEDAAKKLLPGLNEVKNCK